MTELNALADRAEAAGAEEQKAILLAAFNLLNHDVADWKVRGRFRLLLENSAYTDAALMLVLEGAKLTYQNHGDINGRHMWLVSPNERFVSGATPALALVAAALRAQGEA